MITGSNRLIETAEQIANDGKVMEETNSSVQNDTN